LEGLWEATEERLPSLFDWGTRGPSLRGLSDAALGRLSRRAGPAPRREILSGPMSQENVELARRWIDAGNRADLDGWLSGFAPDAEWHTSGRFAAATALP
jgi:hypothetical protein